jgi:hypothetical protein
MEQSKRDKTIIFLDIDGVLLPFSGGHPSSCGALFPDRELEALSIIFEALPNAVIVLSSTWRVHEKVQNEILDSFRAYGYAFGSPLLDVKDFYDITDPDMHTERQHEIYAWLTEHADVVRAWVALDDEELLEGETNRQYRSTFEGHAVLTDSHVGLTTSDAEKTIQLLRDQLARSQPK